MDRPTLLREAFETLPSKDLLMLRDALDVLNPSEDDAIDRRSDLLTAVCGAIRSKHRIA